MNDGDPGVTGNKQNEPYDFLSLLPKKRSFQVIIQKEGIPGRFQKLSWVEEKKMTSKAMEAKVKRRKYWERYWRTGRVSYNFRGTLD